MGGVATSMEATKLVRIEPSFSPTFLCLVLGPVRRVLGVLGVLGGSRSDDFGKDASQSSVLVAQTGGKRRKQLQIHVSPFLVSGTIVHVEPPIVCAGGGVDERQISNRI